MNCLRIISDSLILFGIMLGASLWRSPYRVFNKQSKNAIFYLLHALALIFILLEDYFIYRGQENSDLFFWHPYFAFTLANLLFVFYQIQKHRERELKAFLCERLLLWQIVILPVFSGFALSLGWLMKLYIRR